MATAEPVEPRRRRAAPWVAVSLILAVLLASASWIGRPATADTAGAAGWLPPDGHRVRLTTGGRTAAVEWSRPTAFSLAQTGSSEFWTWAQVTSVAWDSASYLRSLTHLLDSRATSQGAGEALWVLGTDGARRALERFPDGEALVFEPGPLDLPQAPAAGGSWTSEGELARRLPGREWTVHRYRVEYRAAVPTDAALAGRGCLVITGELGYDDQTITTEPTWCPGSGVVASSAADGRWVPGSLAPAPVVPEPTPFDWGRAESLEFADRVLNQTGVGVSQVSPVAPPGVDPGGSVVLVNQVLPDVMALDPSTDPAPVAWHARPGGVPTTAGSFGGITVVATADRTAVAYGPQGQWLWEQELSDITRVPPVRLGGTAVFATLDGRVTAFDLTTGAEAWQADLAGEIRRTPLVAGDRLLVADQTGALTCLDATGAQLWVVETGAALSLAASPGPDPVVVVGRDGSPVLQAFRVSDGSRVWRTRHYEDPRDIVALAGRFVLRDSDRTVAVDAVTGQPVWSWAQARTWAAAGGGDRVLLLTDSELVLLDRDGARVTSWPHRLGEVSQAVSYLTADGDTVVAYGPQGMSVGRLP